MSVAPGMVARVTRRPALCSPLYQMSFSSFSGVSSLYTNSSSVRYVHGNIFMEVVNIDVDAAWQISLIFSEVLINCSETSAHETLCKEGTNKIANCYKKLYVKNLSVIGRG